MSFAHSGNTFSKRAGVDLSAAGQYRFVKDNGSGKAILCGSGEVADGVCQNEPVLNETATIQSDHHSKVVSGGVIALGDKVMSNAQGNAVAATSGNHPLGTAQEAAVAGQVISVKLEISLTPLA